MTYFENEIEFTRVNNDVNGNPRYVCHYLEFKPYQPEDVPYKRFSYEEALKAARELGGRKFHNKQYGGGIVFQSYNIDNLAEAILVKTGHAVECHRKPTDFEIKRGCGATHWRTFLRKDISKKNGELKAKFKADDGLFYSTR